MSHWFRSLIAFAFAVALGAQDTVVLLVRHGEKVSEAADAELSEAGRQRAERLAALFAPLKPAALFASDRLRTQQTLAPLAKATGLTVQARKAADAAGLAAHLLGDWKGRTVVVCGHSNTVGPIAAALGHQGPFREPEGFDLYWVVRISPQGRATLEERPQAVPPPAAR